MLSLRRIKRLPPNIGEFIGEVAEALKHLYGAEAAAHYKEIAPAQLQSAARHPSVAILACFAGGEAAGLLMAVQRDLITQFSLLHVLRRFQNQGVEEKLVVEAVKTCRAGGVDAILAEYVAFGPLNDREVYAKLGFETIARRIMSAPLTAAGLSRPGPLETTPLEAHDALEIAELIVSAYAQHPGRRLHAEVQDAESAAAFVRAVAGGHYGPSASSYCRGLRRDCRYAGVVLGCEAAPKVGFVLHVVVRPEYQNHGLGTRLLQELARAFRKEGCDRIALGVTTDNPARRLYERLGFRLLRLVTAHVWWRP